jgi:hypothetical protein
LKDRHQDPNGRPQPKVGAVEQGFIASEMDTAAASFNIVGAEGAQLLG